MKVWIPIPPGMVRRLIVGFEDLGYLVFEIPGTSDPVPLWLADLAEALGGLHVANNSLEALPIDERHRKIHDAAQSAAKDRASVWSRAITWFLDNDNDKLISPSSKMTVAQYVEKRMKEDTVRSLELAGQVAPGDARIFHQLAEKLSEQAISEPDNTSHTARAQYRRWALALDHITDWKKDSFAAEHEQNQQAMPAGIPSIPETWTNSLGMKFVRVGENLVSIWETRVKDFSTFATANAYRSATQPSWNNPDFVQTENHPVVFVSWIDAQESVKKSGVKSCWDCGSTASMRTPTPLNPRHDVVRGWQAPPIF